MLKNSNILIFLIGFSIYLSNVDTHKSKKHYGNSIYIYTDKLYDAQIQTNSHFCPT